MAHFLGGLNREIQDVLDYKEYTNITGLFHLACKAEREVQGRHVRTQANSFAGRTSSFHSGCHTRFLCQNRVLIICMTQDQMFHTYGQKCSQITKCHNIEYNYYINNVFKD
jgi:hypothetical protein